LTQLPIIFTVRTPDEGGKFDFAATRLVELLEVAKRAGCEFIDFQAAWFHHSGVVSCIQSAVRVSTAKLKLSSAITDYERRRTVS
jgi:3-dehydroquinate dehydratase